MVDKAAPESNNQKWPYPKNMYFAGFALLISGYDLICEAAGDNGSVARSYFHLVDSGDVDLYNLVELLQKDGMDSAVQDAREKVSKLAEVLYPKVNHGEAPPRLKSSEAEILKLVRSIIKPASHPSAPEESPAPNDAKTQPPKQTKSPVKRRRDEDSTVMQAVKKIKTGPGGDSSVLQAASEIRAEQDQSKGQT